MTDDHDDTTPGTARKLPASTTAIVGSRRAVLAATASGAVGLLAGCFDALGDRPGDDEEDATDLPRVEDPPDLVYIPTHREGMWMPDPLEAGDYAVGPMVSYAHRFWLVDGGEPEEAGVSADDDVHLMATVWDPETDTVLPTDEGLSMRVYEDGDLVDERPPWPMLSQTMGFHFGDNIPLDGDGTYEVEIHVPPIGARTTGAFEGRFQDSETVTFEFTFDDEFVDALLEAVEYTDEDDWGAPGALEPGHGGMIDYDGSEHGGDHGGDHDGDHGDGTDDGNETSDDHGDGGMSDDGHGDSTDDSEMGDDHGDGGMADEHDGHDGMDGHHGVPTSALPEPAALPGTLQTDEPPVSGDADVPITVVDEFHGWEPYLLVSPRTPYNAIPLPSMTLEATVTRDGDVVAEGVDLVPTLDDVAGFHYGAEIGDLEPGDDLEISVVSPPQTARHAGYETAFVDMEPIEVTVEGW